MSNLKQTDAMEKNGKIEITETFKNDFVICGYKKTKKGFDLNKAVLIDGEGRELVSFRHLTEKGYFSKAILLPCFDYTEIKEAGQNLLKVSDLTGEKLIKSYSGIEGRTFETSYQKENRGKGVATKAWTSVMYDPYDRG